MESKAFLDSFKPPYGELIFRVFCPLAGDIGIDAERRLSMKKKVNLGLLIMATGLVLLAAAFITACGPVEEGDKVWTVRFDSNSDGVIANPKSQEVKDSGTATTPGPLTWDASSSIDKTKPGFYKDSGTDATYPQFKGWFADLSDTDPFDFSATISQSITLIAKWDPTTPSGGPTKIELTGASKLEAAVTYIKDDTSKTSNTKYTLVMSSETPSGQVVLNQANTDLTIIGIGGNSNIKSPNLSSATGTNAKVFLLIGKSGAAASSQDGSIKLTLTNIGIQGSDTATGDSLIRVQNGASLTLDDETTIEKHENNAGGSGGATGNGSAICVINGGQLFIKQGSFVTGNKSTATQANKNLVGGIFAIGTDDGRIRSKITMSGGEVKNNTMVIGNTADMYITETVDLVISGKVSVGELTLNADKIGSNDVNAFIVVASAVTNKVEKLCLRSTEPPSGSNDSPATSLGKVKTRWTGQEVIKAASGYTLKNTDIAQFELYEFRGAADFSTVTPVGSNKITAFKIEDTSTSPNFGKLVAK